MAVQCKQCGKPLTNTRAGSFTSYFFQQNYCQCNRSKATGPDKASAQRKSAGKGSAARRQELPASEVCTRCGKSVAKRRAGSFTSFLFHELRCQCAQPSLPKKERSARTNTQVRRQAMAAKRGFTANFKANADAGRKLPQVDFSTGTIIGGAFKIVSVIGEGGMGIVYLAQHLSLNRPYALKVLSPSIVSEQSWLRFKAEAKTLSVLNHPGLVRVYDLGIHENTVPYYSMDYLDGETLEELLVRKGPQELEYTISIFLSVLDALAYAHRNNVVHRDIKPANIFICKNQEIKILDFGISKLVGEKRNQELTAVGEVFGSPYYMSPEQCRGEQIDFRSDIYSTGCTLFEALTGYVPFEGANSLEIAMLHEEGEVPSLSDVCEISFPSSCNVVIEKCLAKLPQERYQSAKEMAIDLTRIKEGKSLEAYASVASKPKSALEADKSYSISGRLVAVSLFAVFALSLACGLAFFLFNSKSQLAKIKLAEYSPNSDEYNSMKLSKERALAPDRGTLESEAIERAVDIRSSTSPSTASPATTESLVKSYLKSAPKYYSQIVVNKNGEESKHFDFPKTFSLGRLTIVPNSAVSLDADATGFVAVPSGYMFLFSGAAVLEAHPELLDRFRSDELVGLTFECNPEKSNLPWASVSRLKSLQMLNLSAIRLNAHSLECMERLPLLRYLEFSQCALDTSMAEASVSLPKLRSLTLSRIENIALLLRALSGKSHFSVLTLVDVNLAKEDVSAIASVHSLESLTFRGSHLTGAELDMLTSLSNLKELSLSSVGVDNKLTDILSKFKNLEVLELPADVKLAKSDEQKLRLALPHLREAF